MKIRHLLTLAAIAASVGFSLSSCDESTKERIGVLVETGIDGAIGKMEDQADKGELAIRTCDKCYTNASKKLIKLQTLMKDADQNISRFNARAQEYEASGKSELAQKNREQAQFFEKQSTNYNETIRNRAEKLRAIKQKRESLYEDVHLLREKIVFLKSMKDALDEEDMRRQIDSAESMLSNVQHECNELESEVDLLNSME